MREHLGELRYALPSLSIDNTHRCDDIVAYASRPLYPRKAFAMLVDPSAVARKNAADIVDAVDGGLRERHRDTGTVLAEWEGVDGSDNGDMMRRFWESEAKNEWNGSYSLCVRKSAVEAKRVEVFSARTQKCRAYPWETVGEILVWLAVGFIDEDELDEPDNFVLKSLDRSPHND